MTKISKPLDYRAKKIVKANRKFLGERLMYKPEDFVVPKEINQHATDKETLLITDANGTREIPKSEFLARIRKQVKAENKEAKRLRKIRKTPKLTPFERLMQELPNKLTLK